MHCWYNFLQEGCNPISEVAPCQCFVRKKQMRKTGRPSHPGNTRRDAGTGGEGSLKACQLKAWELQGGKQ